MLDGMSHIVTRHFPSFRPPDKGVIRLLITNTSD